MNSSIGVLRLCLPSQSAVQALDVVEISHQPLHGDLNGVVRGAYLGANPVRLKLGGTSHAKAFEVACCIATMPFPQFCRCGQ